MSAIKTDTIAALATPLGISSVAVFRISGPAAFTVCDKILRQKKPTDCYISHTLHRALVIDKNDTVDDVLVAVFHEPRSYTGENAVEITCHGGAVPIRRILTLLLTAGARQAEAGEFTLRAYLNGKMDLAQAEAVIDAIEAQTDEGLRLARAQQSGELSREIGALREIFLGLAARIEATIDFPEDVGDVPEGWGRNEIRDARARLERLIASAGRGMLYRDGIRVVLAGKPNAGKSSLLNALLRADRAIVTDIPGTTRDSIEEFLSIQGIPVRLTDTAGLRESADIVERLGIDRARSAVANADIALVVKDASAADSSDDEALHDPSQAAKRIVVWNKIDLINAAHHLETGVRVSARTGEGMDNLEAAIVECALSAEVTSAQSGGATVTHARHLHALEAARDSALRAMETLEAGMPLDFLSIEVQAALSALGLITGETAPQEIVNEIFHRFCIGK